MYKTIDENVKKMNSISADLFKYVQSKSSSDIVAPNDLENEEQIMYLFLGSIGLDLFYDCSTEIRIPEQIKGNKDLETIWKTSAKQMFVKQILIKARNVVFKIKDKLKKEQVSKVNFQDMDFSHSEVIATILLATLEGCQVNWNELDHSFCDIHTDWNCSFVRGETYDFEKLMNATLTDCINLEKFDRHTLSKLPLKDEITLNMIEESNKIL